MPLRPLPCPSPAPATGPARRDFLRGGAGLGAGVALALGAGSVLAGSADAAPAEAAAPTATAAGRNLLPALVADTSAGAWAFVPVAADGPMPRLADATGVAGFDGHSIAASVPRAGRFAVLTRGWEAVTPGRHYRALVTIAAPRAVPVSAQITWYDRKGSYLAVSKGSARTVRAGEATELATSALAPAGAYGGAVQVNLETPARAEERFDVGRFALAEGADPSAWSAGTGSNAQPSGPGFLRLQDADPRGRRNASGYWDFGPGMTLQAALEKCRGGQILTLPPRCVVRIGDFDRNADYCSVRFGQAIATGCRGIQGTDRTSVIEPRPHALNTRSTGSTNQCVLIGVYGMGDSWRPVLKNFTLRGTPQRDGLEHNGIRIWTCTRAVLYGLKLVGASPGSTNVPPGETFGIGVTHSPNCLISHTEVDGRDTRGKRVCASPIGWNMTDNSPGFVLLDTVYLHHAKTSALTFYSTNNIVTQSVRSEYNGSGSGLLNGNQINHENSNGRIRHFDLSLIADFGRNGGQHIALQNDIRDMPDVQMTVKHFDRSEPAGDGAFSVMIDDRYGRGQKVHTMPRISLSGHGAPLKAYTTADTSGCTPTTGWVRYS